MTISFFTSTNLDASQNSVNLEGPNTVNGANDAHNLTYDCAVALCTWKAYSIAAPSGLAADDASPDTGFGHYWRGQGSITSGAVASGISTGSVRTAAYAAYDMVGTLPDTRQLVSGASVGLSRTLVFRSLQPAGLAYVAPVAHWELADTVETSTAVSATGTVAAGSARAGDLLAIAVGIKDDAPTHTSQTLTVPGLTLGAITWTRDASSVGQDATLYTGYCTVTAGTATAGTATYAATSSVSGASATAVEIVVLREELRGPAITPGAAGAWALSWANDLVQSCTVERTTSMVSPSWTTVYTGTGSSTTDTTTRTAGQKYWYRVTVGGVVSSITAAPVFPFTEDFSDTTGATATRPWPKFDDATPVYPVHTADAPNTRIMVNSGVGHFQGVTGVTTGSGGRIALAPGAFVADQAVTCRYRFNNANTGVAQFRLSLRVRHRTNARDSSTLPDWGYTLRIDAGAVNLNRYDFFHITTASGVTDGVYTLPETVGSGARPASMSSGTWYRTRFEIFGTYPNATIRYRIWLDGSAEPTTWVTHTETNPASANNQPISDGGTLIGFASAGDYVTDANLDVDDFTFYDPTVVGPAAKTGAATGTYAFSGGSTTGTRAPKSTGVGTHLWAGSATGVAPAVPAKTGAASGAFALAGTAVGARTPKGRATQLWVRTDPWTRQELWSPYFAFNGTAVGAAATTNQASGAWSFNGTSSGMRTPKSTAVGTYALNGGAITGSRPTKGAAVGTFLFSGAGITYSDDFNRADGALGANWVSSAGAAPVPISGNRVVGTASAQAVRWATTISGAGAVFSQATYTGTPFAGVSVALPSFAAGAGLASIGAFYTFRQGGSTAVLVQKNAGAGTNTGLADAGFALVAGDVIRLEYDGTTLKAYVNGTNVITHVPVSPLAMTRNVGFHWGSTETTAILDNWSGGQVSGSLGARTPKATAVGAFAFSAGAAVTYSDDFNRADGALGSNWVSKLTGTDAASISSNAVRAGNSNTLVRYAIPTPGTQFAQAKILDLSPERFAVVVGASGFSTDNVVAGEHYRFTVNDGSITLTREDLNGAQTATSSFYACQVGDVLRVEWNGAQVRGYVNGVLRITRNDSTFAQATHAYVGFRTGGGATTPVLDDWSGGALGALGSRTPKSTAVGTFAWAGSSTSIRTPKATGSTTWTFDGTSIAGTRAPKSTAVGTYNFTGTQLSGQVMRQGAAVGTYAWSGTGVGARTPRATGTGTFAFAGSATGTAPGVLAKVGAASGAFAWAGSSTGARTPVAAGAGAFAWAGGSTTGARAPKAVAVGTFALTGTSSGARTPKSTGVGTHLWVGSAVGSRTPRGNAVGTFAFAGSGVGAQPAFMAPTGLIATPISASQIDLRWDTVSTATSYQLERNGVVLVTQAGTTYSDTALTRNTQYAYRVRAVR